MKYDIVLFDLDGTLLNTLEDLADSVNYVMDQMGYPLHSLEDIRKFVGNGIRTLMIKATPQGEENPRFEEGFAMFKAYYLTHNQIKTRPYDGVMELLHDYEKEDVPMAIVTNKNQESVDVLVRDVFRNHVRVAVGDNGVRARKPAADPVEEALRRLRQIYADQAWARMGGDEALTEADWLEWIKPHVLYVGDSEVDAATAENAGVDCALCAWGFREEAMLVTLPHAVLLHKPLELATFMRG
ncbi:MAG: HAD family hydrolase [Lachnospiraceae bacterium]|nr:HAD family hydrolase [Lachnospiraceae bacterium]